MDEAPARRLGALGIVAGMLLLAVVFASRFSPARTVAVEVARPSIAAFLILVAANGLGRLARFERLSDRIAAGLPVFGTLCALFALIDTRLILPGAMGIVTYGAVAAAREPLPLPGHPHPMLLPPALIAIACALAPVNSPDELVYKLAVPQSWLLHGRMTELPLNSNSYLAMAMQGADSAAIVLGGGVAAKLIHFASFLVALAIVRRIAGDFGAIVVAWTPALMIIAGWAWNEWPLLAVLALALERWLADDVDRSSIALGCALAIKYTAIPAVVAFAVLVLMRSRRNLVRWVAFVSLFGGFFYVRNLVWTGSPVAPLLLPDAPAVENYLGNAWAGLLTGADVFDARAADEALGILLPLAALLGLFAWKKERELLLLGALQMPVFLTIAPGSRNMIAGVLPLALAGVRHASAKGWITAPVKAVAVLACGLQLVLVAYTLESYDFLRVLSGRETPQQYEARTRNYAPAYSWIAARTPPASRVLLLGENRTFHLPRQSMAGGNLDGPRVAAWLGQSLDPTSLQRQLRDAGVTHVLIHKPWYRVGSGKLTPIEREHMLEVPPDTHGVLIGALSRFAKRVFEDREYVVYELR